MEKNILKTDLYQLTMMAAQYRKGIHNQVVTCEAFVRRLPNERKFLVMAGTEEIRNFLTNLRFSKDDIAQLKELEPLKQVFATSNFDKFLEDFCFTGDLWAMAEGEIAFAGEPLIQITATLPEVHIAETYILSVLNHDMKVSSKAARIVLAARGRPVLEFGTRRTHHEAAVNAARSAYLAGFSATSNVEAAVRHKIPIAGTMSHMWVMIHESEAQAYKSFKETYNSPILLIDTYDTLNGAELASQIPLLEGVRLDSGDLNQLSREVRTILDNNGCNRAKIIVSGDLNEYSIDELAKTGAPIDVYAVGTELVVSKDVPSLGAVYKVVYDDTNSRPLVKLSSGKVTLPGHKQVFLDQRNGGWSHLLTLKDTIEPSAELIPLLDCHIKGGEVQDKNVVDLEVSRKYCNAALLNLPSELTSLSKQSTEVPLHPHVSVKRMFNEAMNEHRLAMGKRRDDSI